MLSISVLCGRWHTGQVFENAEYDLSDLKALFIDQEIADRDYNPDFKQDGQASFTVKVPDQFEQIHFKLELADIITDHIIEENNEARFVSGYNALLSRPHLEPKTKTLHPANTTTSSDHISSFQNGLPL